MNFEEALRVELTSIPLLQNKIFPLSAPEGTKAPYLVYVSSEGVNDKSLNGYLDSKEVDCEINIICSRYSDLKTLTRETISKIISFQGRSIGNDGPVIQNVTYHKPVEDHERETNQHICVFDITVRF